MKHLLQNVKNYLTNSTICAKVNCCKFPKNVLTKNFRKPNRLNIYMKVCV